MKGDIHPEYYEAKVNCGGCHNTFTLMSTVKELTVNVCYNCHPFYTGTQKILDTEGRVEKFKQKYAKYYKKN